MGTGKNNAKLLAQRHSGGLANFAGNTFESHFAIWRVAVALDELNRGAPTRLALQLKNCHVDDFVEDLPSLRRHYQLKRSTAASWGAVRRDFAAQLRHMGKPCIVTLVVPTDARARKLRQAKHRVVGASVMSFPASLSPQVVLMRQPALSALKALWWGPTVSPVNAELVWSAIDWAWQQVRKPGNFVAIERVLAALSDQAIDSIRQPWVEPARWAQFEKLLGRVTGLSFNVANGLFSYSGAGQSGRYSCRNPALKKLIRRVLKQRPTSLDDFMELLP